MDRLLRRTDDALSGGDTRARHRLVGHLKAAVAATRAGEATGARPPGASAEMVARFRADLASAVANRSDGVRPDARAAGDTGAPPDPEPMGQTPGHARNDDEPTPPGSNEAPDAGPKPDPDTGLDTDPTTDPKMDPDTGRRAAPRAAGAQPDRTPTQPAAEATDPGAFAAFAARRGARDLPDVLEAAAAFATEVEGLDAFSRQHVMHRACALGFDARTGREAGLRAFGRLLREGRLVRARRGMFALAERAGARA